jgi:cellulose synthase/poly-beta-1,6-N-acetylglucosamine synthase-like glycosyltransferase
LPDQILVVDGSTDGMDNPTPMLGAAVVRAPKPLDSAMQVLESTLPYLLGDLVLVIHPGVVLDPGDVARVLRTFQHRDIAMVSGSGWSVLRLREVLAAGGFPACIAEVERAAPLHSRRRRTPTVAVIVPALNEERHIARTLESIRGQTWPPDRIIVVDDCSQDRTGQIARRIGVEVVRPVRNSGSKAAAHNIALPLVTEEIVVNVDADTVLAPDALERLLLAFADERVAAASGAVIPYQPSSSWERGRVLEYLSYQAFFRMVQARARSPLVLVGCFCACRTAVLQTRSGFKERTITEDMDLNWDLLLDGHRVEFVPFALCFAMDPPDFRVFHRQVSRWTRGFLQCLSVHRARLLRNGRLAMFALANLAEAFLAPVYAVMALWVALVWGWRALALLCLMDLLMTIAPLLVGARRYRVPLGFVLRNIPALYRNRVVYSVVMLESVALEWIFRRRLTAWAKGHV